LFIYYYGNILPLTSVLLFTAMMLHNYYLIHPLGGKNSEYLQKFSNMKTDMCIS